MNTTTQSEHYFGGCPTCGGTDGYLNVCGNHWFVCDRHRTKWCAGYNLFSDWHDEDEATWRQNAERLKGLTEADPMPWQPTPEEQANMDRAASAGPGFAPDPLPTDIPF